MNFYEQIVENIIRPTREKYKISKLGPTKFQIISKISRKTLYIQRFDLIILNRYKKKLHLSFYNIKNYELSQPLPCVIYLHANNGSRHQGLCYLNSILENQMCMMLFDSCGSGVSDGQYITLGVLQSEDLQYVIQYLIKFQNIKDIAIWGRSMGAVTGLLYNSKNIRQIKASIYDSPFSSLKQLIKQLAKKKTGFPQFFFSPIMNRIETLLKQKINVNFDDLNLIDFAPKIKSPGMFITSKQDKLVNCEHTEKIFNVYKGQKIIEYINCEHHQNRPDQLIKKCIEYMKQKFKKKKLVNQNYLPYKRAFQKSGNLIQSQKLYSQQLIKKEQQILEYGISSDRKSLDKKPKDNYLCFFQNICVKQMPQQKQFTFDPLKRVSLTDVDRQHQHKSTYQYNYSKPRIQSSTYSNQIISPQKISLLKSNNYMKQIIPNYFDQNQKGIRKVLPIRREK